jgi:hypothetical protein
MKLEYFVTDKDVCVELPEKKKYDAIIRKNGLQVDYIEGEGYSLRFIAAGIPLDNKKQIEQCLKDLQEAL